MKTLNLLIVLIFTVFLCAAGAQFVASQDIGTLAAENETKTVFAGCAKTGVETNVCFGTNCSSGGCGCTVTQKLINDPSGMKPAGASPCGTSSCSTPQGLSSDSCGG